MSVTRAIDLEDTEGLLAADRDGLLRAASSAGAQVRAIAAAVDEGALDPLRADGRPRSVIWVAGRGPAETAGALLAAASGGAANQPIALLSEAPPWVGPLDVLVVAGDDPGDPALVSAASTGVRRSARVVVVTPYEGPLRDSTAGRVAVLAPRLMVPDEFGLCRYLAAGLAALHTVDPRPSLTSGRDLALLADELDAEALRNSAGRELFTNPAKTIAARMAGRRVALAGDCAATLALARHGSSVLLRIAHEAVAATGLADAVVALRAATAVPRWTTFSTTKRSTGRYRSGCGCWCSRWPPNRRWWRPEPAGSRTSTCWPPRMCPTGPVARPVPRFRRRWGAHSAPSSNWQYWPFGWRWPRFTCDWRGDR